MSLFDEDGLRAIIAEEIGKALHRVTASTGGADRPIEQYLPVAEAARMAAVAPATIRAWMDDGRLARYHAGRELRVRRAELEALLRTSPKDPGASERSPEAEADRFLQRRQQLRAQSTGRRG
jgi:excisionase family DNA binding protein